MQLPIALSTNNPHDGIVRSICSCDPRRSLPRLTHAPGEDYRRRGCRSNLVGLNRAARTENKIGSMARGISGR
jgi:hypothetical protein